MSPLHRVEELRFAGDGAAPGVARRGPCRTACGGIGRPWRGGRTWRWKQMRGRDLGAGGAAGLEHEGGGRGLRSEDDPFVEDYEAAIEEFAEFDAAAGVGAVLGTGRELQPAGPEADGVVAGDLAGVAATEHEGQIPEGGPPRGRGVGRRPREARIEVGEERGEKGV